ncbi:hypothetical protein FTUN_8949 [Frigoriglobus tundricola]|uniref:Uncharacterized protein n=1 Tax=Frigoriglobus tundricola TaxID=2774151 RepID=A0A6M5Z6J0_9BACT|nr:hypothetical protein FTUN_8949 [Frigoriglobus tundricola]
MGPTFQVEKEVKNFVVAGLKSAGATARASCVIESGRPDAKKA